MKEKKPIIYTTSQKDHELAKIDLNETISAKQRAFLTKIGILKPKKNK